MTDRRTAGIAAAVGIVGVIVGYVIGSGGSGEEEVTARLDALAEQVEALSGTPVAVSALEDRTAALAGTVEESTASLARTVEEKTAPLGAALEESGARSSALADRVAGLEAQVATLSETVVALDERMAAAADGISGQLDGVTETLAALGAGGAATLAAAAPEPAAMAAAAPTETPDKADRLAEAVGADGLILAIGETGTVQQQKVFLSRVTEDAAHLVVIGAGNVSAGLWTGPADLGNGCTLSYLGGAGGKAYLKPAC